MILKNGTVYTSGKFLICDVEMQKETITAIDTEIISDKEDIVYDCTGKYVFPALTDIHVHLREPGYSYKETIKTGTAAAAHGGFGNICAMPNLSPVPDSISNLEIEENIIEKYSSVNVYPYAAITQNEDGITLSDFNELSEKVFAFSDDGHGVADSSVMKKAMTEAKKYGKAIAAHCEDMNLRCGGYIHAGDYCRTHGHIGISSESEYKPIERDIALVRETGCKYHVCHISCSESVELIRRAKSEGLDVTCETAPHYLVFNDSMLEDDGRFKMNPPIREERDRQALIDGIMDGTIDFIATDHAPHSTQEKSGGLKNSLMGVVGLETSFAVMYTHFVKTGIITLEKLISLMHDRAIDVFGIGSSISVGEKADITVFNLNKKYTINPMNFQSKGRSTPFCGMEVYGECELTTLKGKISWQKNTTVR